MVCNYDTRLPNNKNNIEKYASKISLNHLASALTPLKDVSKQDWHLLNDTSQKVL